MSEQSDIEEQDGFTLTIIGTGPWEKRTNEAEARRMAAHVASVEHVHQRCSTCALRTGTDANGSALALRFIDSGLVMQNSFMCHSVGEDVQHECAGFTELLMQQKAAERATFLDEMAKLTDSVHTTACPSYQQSTAPEDTILTCTCDMTSKVRQLVKMARAAP